MKEMVCACRVRVSSVINTIARCNVLMNFLCVLDTMCVAVGCALALDTMIMSEERLANESDGDTVSAGRGTHRCSIQVFGNLRHDNLCGGETSKAGYTANHLPTETLQCFTMIDGLGSKYSIHGLRNSSVTSNLVSWGTNAASATSSNMASQWRPRTFYFSTRVARSSCTCIEKIVAINRSLIKPMSYTQSFQKLAMRMLELCPNERLFKILAFPSKQQACTCTDPLRSVCAQAGNDVLVNWSDKTVQQAGGQRMQFSILRAVPHMQCIP